MLLLASMANFSLLGTLQSFNRLCTIIQVHQSPSKLFVNARFGVFKTKTFGMINTRSAWIEYEILTIALISFLQKFYLIFRVNILYSNFKHQTICQEVNLGDP